MPADRTPRPGQVFRSPKGAPLLYVRTEKRPGAPEPEHFFVRVDPERRVVMQYWNRELPDGLELTFDPQATERADRLEEELADLRRRHDAVVSAMRAAMLMVPEATAQELRRAYRAELERSR